MTGSLGSDHDHVDVRRRDDGLKVNAEAVRKEQRFALGEIRRDVLLVGGRLLGVGNADHDHVGKPHGLGGVIHRKPVLFGDLAALAAGIQANDDLAAAVLEIQGMSVTLRAEAEDGEGLAFEEPTDWRLCRSRFWRA